MDNIIIAVDGPAGAGKSTVAKMVAKRLNISYLDTGAMYRVVTYGALKSGIDVDDDESVIEIADEADITFDNAGRIYLNGEDVSEQIRSREVSANVSVVAQIQRVRIRMVELQREIARNIPLILDGRDIGTYVFPNADFKFFLIASPHERGRRRCNELKLKGIACNIEEIVEDIKKRDLADSQREFAPLKKADDAIEIDTTHMSIEEVVEKIIGIVENGK